LAIFEQRFTRQGLTQIFVYCAIPIHIWAIINMLRDIPSWLLYMRIWEVIATICYTLCFALFETLIVLLVVLLAGLIVPRRWVLEKYVPLCSVWLTELAVMAIVMQHFITQYLPKRLMLGSCVLILGVSTLIVLRFPGIGKVARAISERLSVLSFIYIILDVLGVFVVVARIL
jgi:hypothetical protein